MLKPLSLIALVYLLATPAFAARRAPELVLPTEPGVEAASPHQCLTVAALKTGFKGAKITVLNAGQFHVLEGTYIATPPLSGPPDADSALLVQVKKKNLIFWMKGNPSCASEIQPMMVSDGFVRVLRSINPGTGETIDSGDSEGDVTL